jgi:hypothetical protein
MNTVTALRDWTQRHLLDWFYAPTDATCGRWYFDGLLHPFGFTVWAGRRHLVVDFMLAQNAAVRVRQAFA